MADLTTRKMLAALMAWQKDQSIDYVITIDSAGCVAVHGAPCACTSIVVDVDWPYSPGFLPALAERAEVELQRARVNCICRRERPNPGVMGYDDPELVMPFVVECTDCDARGPGDAFTAFCEGWTEVDDAEKLEEIDPVCGFTHLGLCPDCRDRDPDDDRFGTSEVHA